MPLSIKFRLHSNPAMVQSLKSTLRRNALSLFSISGSFSSSVLECRFAVDELGRSDALFETNDESDMIATGKEKNKLEPRTSVIATGCQQKKKLEVANREITN